MPGSYSGMMPDNNHWLRFTLTRAHARSIEQTQLNAWLEQDVVLLNGPVIFVLEFKVGESHFTLSALEQVTDYCLDPTSHMLKSLA